jgi:hypothetical protein
MTSNPEARTDLIELAQRVRIVVEALRRLPIHHTLPFKGGDALCKEVKAIAAQLRKH